MGLEHIFSTIFIAAIFLLGFIKISFILIDLCLKIWDYVDTLRLDMEYKKLVKEFDAEDILLEVME